MSVGPWLEDLLRLAWAVATCVVRVALRVAWALCTFWRSFPRRPFEPGFPYVHVNLDGTARELSPAEQQWLTEEFEPGDGARPWIKSRYESRDLWGSRSGFLARRALPKRITILPVHPDYDARAAPFQFVPAGVTAETWIRDQRFLESLARCDQTRPASPDSASHG